MSNTVSVIAPTMDESGNVLELVRRIAATGIVDEVFFVDDSIDNKTVEAIKEAQATYGNDLEVNYFWRKGSDRRGQLFGAVTDGIARARGDLIIVMDADLQHPPETIPSIVNQLKISETSIVIASRYCKGGNNRGLNGSYRRAVSLASTASARALFPRVMRDVTDPMTGFFGLRKQLFKPERLRPQGFKILLETLVKHPELSPVEVPLHFDERHAGASKTNSGVGKKFLLQLIQLRLPNAEALRKLSFVAVGGSGVLLSFAVLWLGINIARLDFWLAYLIQTVVVIEYNFLLSRFLTWGDRRKEVPFWTSWTKFHGVRLLLTIPLNQALFFLLTMVGVHFLVANTVCIMTTTVINFIISDRFVFKGKAHSHKSAPSTDEAFGGVMASFIIPVKNNHDTIYETVKSIEALEWSGSKEVIIVGSHDDTTWSALKDYVRSGLVKTFEVDVERKPGRRDANVKRHYGLKHASGEILAVIDSDVTLPVTWLKTVAEHFDNGFSAVGGPVIGLDSGFWTRYIDENPVASKTPRMKGLTFIDSKTIRTKKPPVTANFACTRSLYKDKKVKGGPNMSFRNSYEDYEWFSRIVRADYVIVRDEALGAVRYHRQGLKPLLREYTRSGKGCADHIVSHPACGFAQTRSIQLVSMVSAVLALLAMLVIAPLWTIAGLAVAYLSYSALCFKRVRRVEVLLYPLLSALFTSAFIYGSLSRFVRFGFRRPAYPAVAGFRTAVLED